MTNRLSSLKSVVQHYRMSTSVLRQLLKNPFTVEKSIDIIKNGIKDREKNFLNMIKKCVFENDKSPYKALLDNAGHTLTSVQRLVNNCGLQNTLKKLYSDGVYIDIYEYKGKKDAIRGEKRFHFKETDFNNPLLTAGLDTQTGGTTGRSTKVNVPLEYILHNTVYGIHASSLYGIPGKKVIVWLPILPALEGLFFNIRFGVAGNPPVKWFSQVDGRHIKPSMADRIKTFSTIWLSGFYGIKLPGPEFVDIKNSLEIARWMNRNPNGASGFAIVTYASSAFRLIMEARKHGLKLGETVFWLMGEPLTEKKHREIEAYGCKAYTLYGCNELMLIGHACLNPEAVDDIHVCTDKLGLIQYTRKVEQSDVEVNSFLFTTLLDISSKIFLNTEVGDYGVAENRNCGCPFETLGYTEHIHTIRSFEKLTAEGMTYVGSNLVPLVEEILPDKFGGNATDYQFVEEEDSAGYSRLFAIVSPDIGEINEEEFKGAVFNGLTHEVSPGYSGVRAMREVWSHGETLQIKRAYPIPTKRGKIMPLYIKKTAMVKNKT